MNRRMVLKRLILRGESYQRTLPLDEKLTIIKGDGFSGKSLVLNLIAYCLGGKTDLIDLTVQKELALYCDFIYLQFSIDEQIYTVMRRLKVDKNTIEIYMCEYEECSEYSPWKKNIEEANVLFAKMLGMRLHSILRKKPGSSELHPEAISFRDVFRYVFIKQGELGTSHFMQWDNTFVSGKNKEVFKILFDMVIPNIDDIEKEIQKAQNEKNQLEGINKGVLDYLKKREAENLLQLIDIREKYTNNINGYLMDKDRIIKEKRDGNTQMFLVLNKDILSIDEEIKRISQKQADTKLSLLNKEKLLSDYRKELDELNATLEVIKKLKISEHSEHCPLCNSIIDKPMNVNNVEDIELAANQLCKKKNTLEQLVEKDKIFIERTSKELETLDEKRKIYYNALNEYRHNMEVPYLAEIESYNSLIKDITEEKNKINSLIDLHKEMDINQNRINQLDDDLKTLQKKKDLLLKKENREKDILSLINKRYRELMKRFNFSNITDDLCYVSKETYLPYYGGNSIIRHTSGSLLLCMGVAYIGTIIEIITSDSRSSHTGFLLIDTVSNNIGTNKSATDSIDPNTYAEIIKYLYELSEKIQMVIVDNTPPDMNGQKKEYVFRRIENGKNLEGLIDTELNEIL